jgi:hypothetical protein
VETPVETPVESNTSSTEVEKADSITEEMQTVVSAFLKSNIDGTGLVEKIGIFNSDYEYVEHTRYYDDALLCKAMMKDSVFTNIAKASELTVLDVETVSRGIYKVSVKNDLGNEFELVVYNHNDAYIIDASSLFLPAKLALPNDIEPYLNGVLLSESEIVGYGSYGNCRYDIPYVLAHIENKMEYETGFSEPFNKTFIVDAVLSDDERVDLRYTVSSEDLKTILPKVSELWTALHTAAKNQDTAAVAALLTEDSPLLVNTIIDGHKATNAKLTLKQFDARTDVLNLANSKNILALNLRGTFIGEYIYGTRTPSKFNWVVIHIQEDGSYKLYDASTPVWIDADINANPTTGDVVLSLNKATAVAQGDTKAVTAGAVYDALCWVEFE